jgi:hypothetical protein
MGTLIEYVSEIRCLARHLDLPLHIPHLRVLEQGNH